MRLQTNPGRAIAVLTILSATLATSRLWERTAPEVLAQPLSEMPSDIDGWKSAAEETLADNVISVLKPSSYISRTYVKGGQSVGLFIAYYAQQRAGETMHSPKHCLPGSGWEIWDYTSAELPTARGVDKINKYFIQNAGARAVVLYWYQSKRRIVASEYLGKLWLIRDSVWEGKTGASIVRITCADQPVAVAGALHFASKVGPALHGLLGD